jgi:hypothetical protein
MRTFVDSFLRSVLTAVVALLICPTSAWPVQQPQHKKIDPDADQILRQMSDFLGRQKQFSFHSLSSLEVVLKSGQKVEYEFTVEGAVERPNKFFAERKGEKEEAMYFDGKTLTITSPKLGLYAQAPVSGAGSIEDAIDLARTKLDIDLPAADLLYANSYDILTEDVVSGINLGAADIDGVKCSHLAFRGNEVDWQIWVAEGERPLPLKFTIVSKKVPGAPEYSVRLTNWELTPRLGEDHFAFTPKAGMNKIEFMEKKAPPQPAHGAKH